MGPEQARRPKSFKLYKDDIVSHNVKNSMSIVA
jgi:hypothetical protein